jgi:flavodoxin
MSKPIILFYSFEGNTKKVAEFLSKELNLPCEQIKPVKDLKSKGFSK